MTRNALGVVGFAMRLCASTHMDPKLRNMYNVITRTCENPLALVPSLSVDHTILEYKGGLIEPFPVISKGSIDLRATQVLIPQRKSPNSDGNRHY